MRRFLFNVRFLPLTGEQVAMALRRASDQYRNFLQLDALARETSIDLPQGGGVRRV